MTKVFAYEEVKRSVQDTLPFTWDAYIHISAGVGFIVPSVFLFKHLVSAASPVAEQVYIFTPLILYRDLYVEGLLPYCLIQTLYTF